MDKNYTRRDFLRKTSTSLGALSALGMLSCNNQASMPDKIPLGSNGKIRLAIVGTGSRGSTTWGRSVVSDYSDHVEYVGLCDINTKRLELAQNRIGRDVPVFTDFDKMIRQTSPDRVIVTTVDALHAKYVIRAMELGCDVICEKPFGTTAKQCQAMHDAEKKLKRNIIVTFNARYFASKTKVKRLLLEGAIGEVYSINFDEFLDLDHGASYYRRWHGIRKNSGSLLIHKGSHHFDQINWWLDSDPVEVMAYGDMRTYGSKGPFRSTHCRVCPHKSECKFYWDVTQDQESVDLYVNCESEDGYLIDACLYRKQVDAPDTNTVQVKYDNNVLLTYTLNAAVPYEGQIITINGSKGRIELRENKGQPWEVEHDSELRLTQNFGESVMLYPTSQREGGHGGADPMLKDHVFFPDAKDELGHRAGSRAGIMSSIIGIAACKSIDSGKPVRIKDIVNIT